MRWRAVEEAAQAYISLRVVCALFGSTARLFVFGIDLCSIVQSVFLKMAFRGMQQSMRLIVLIWQASSIFVHGAPIEGDEANFGAMKRDSGCPVPCEF